VGGEPISEGMTFFGVRGNASDMVSVEKFGENFLKNLDHLDKGCSASGVSGMCDRLNPLGGRNNQICVEELGASSSCLGGEMNLDCGYLGLMSSVLGQDGPSYAVLNYLVPTYKEAFLKKPLEVYDTGSVRGNNA
jgi:hypothetical protein